MTKTFKVLDPDEHGDNWENAYECEAFDYDEAAEIYGKYIHKCDFEWCEEKEIIIQVSFIGHQIKKMAIWYKYNPSYFSRKIEGGE